MITEDIEHKIGTSQTLCSVQSKEAERQELQRLVEDFEAKGGKVDKVPSSDWRVESLGYNRQGPINPQKKVKQRWTNHGIAKNFQA